MPFISTSCVCVCCVCVCVCQMWTILTCSPQKSKSLVRRRFLLVRIRESRQFIPLFNGRSCIPPPCVHRRFILVQAGYHTRATQLMQPACRPIGDIHWACGRVFSSTLMSCNRPGLHNYVDRRCQLRTNCNAGPHDDKVRANWNGIQECSNITNMIWRTSQ